jgi:hypothetical protein
MNLLDDFMGYNQPAKGFVLQIQETLGFWPGANQVISQVVVLGWISKFAIAFWFHATTLMRHGGSARGLRTLVFLATGCGGRLPWFRWSRRSGWTRRRRSTRPP